MSTGNDLYNIVRCMPFVFARSHKSRCHCCFTNRVAERHLLDLIPLDDGKFDEESAGTDA